MNVNKLCIYQCERVLWIFCLLHYGCFQTKGFRRVIHRFKSNERGTYSDRWKYIHLFLLPIKDVYNIYPSAKMLSITTQLNIYWIRRGRTWRFIRSRQEMFGEAARPNRTFLSRPYKSHVRQLAESNKCFIVRHTDHQPPPPPHPPNSPGRMTSRSPARMYETGYATPPMYPDNPPVLHEREDKDMSRMPPLGDGTAGAIVLLLTSEHRLTW